ncbi:hypothetical protein [Acetobacterium tundrae]|uniref:Uncharacterized protein n=1 Tax=Acetobacterium tundrae TaxID=132932 RepID=A0ABR6WMH8_9FIRM|nr:hypothetical protein [Acetobacterium tundrae]MBC3797718.1 hypothetical protein [Acetobacterium tundrae]
MANKNAVCGGFVALNSGMIVDCYSNMTVLGKGTAAGFCGNNKGEIKNSYSTGRVKKAKVTGGFRAKNSGSVVNCFFNKGKANSKKLVDIGLGKLEKDLTFENFYNQLDWDFENIWETADSVMENQHEPFLPTFISKKFYYELPSEKEVIELSTAQQLFKIAVKINEGDKIFAKVRYLLVNDIDLKNKKWTPIGVDENNPFSGTFDGGGYCIKNLLVNDKDLEYAGFFGVIRDAVIVNLGIEGVVKKGKYSGGLVGVNDGSSINCCFANCEITSSQFPGGLVGKNNGEIRHCVVFGKIKNGGKALLPWLLGAGAFAASMLGVLAWFYMGKTPTYPAIPIDDSVSVIPDEKIQPSEGNSVSFEFAKEIIFQNAQSGGVFAFKNPGDSTNNIVVELQLTDTEMINTLGSTGRTPLEQARIEAQPGYSPDTTRQVIGRSGAIPPGYALDEIKLQLLQDGTALKRGEYNAIIYLVFYDITTNEQAMLNTQMPVKLIISE